MRYETAILRQGNWRLLRLLQDGKDRVGEYLSALVVEREEEYAAIMAALDRFAAARVPPNEAKLRHEGGGVYALKAGRQQRLYGFFHGRQCFVFVECCTKKQNKADPVLLRRVRGIADAVAKEECLR